MTWFWKTPFIFFALCLAPFSVFAEGDLTRQTAIEVVVQLGSETEGDHTFYPNKLEFETGKLYKLILENPSSSKHYFTSREFADKIFTRKVQVVERVDGETKRIAEIKGEIRDVEVFPGHILEWWFVPIQTGTITDLHCHVTDKDSDLSHAAAGMVGEILIR